MFYLLNGGKWWAAMKAEDGYLEQSFKCARKKKAPRIASHKATGLRLRFRSSNQRGRIWRIKFRVLPRIALSRRNETANGDTIQF